jgi:RNA polymerase sigma-70 factor (ECF subfamily)
MNLLHQLRDGNPLGWERLTKLYGPLIVWWCEQCGIYGPDAQDVTQDVYLAIHKKGIGEFQHAGRYGSFRNWLRGFTRNKIADYRRRKGKHTAGAGGSDAYDQLNQIPEQMMETEARDDELTERTILVRRLLEQLRSEFEPQTWEAFRRAALDGRPAADIASELGMSANAVYIARSRVLRRLREELEALPEKSSPAI